MSTLQLAAFGLGALALWQYTQGDSVRQLRHRAASEHERSKTRAHPALRQQLVMDPKDYVSSKMGREVMNHHLIGVRKDAQERPLFVQHVPGNNSVVQTYVALPNRK